MIIKIEGLPEGQKIKHINVDISFEDDGSAIVKTKTDPIKDEPKPQPVFDNTETGVQVPDNFQFDGRPQKKVPPEMQDLEF